MKRSLRTAWVAGVFGAVLFEVAGAPASAQTPPAPPGGTAAPVAPSATPATPAAPATVTLLAPGMNGVLAFPGVPNSVDVGPLGKWYVDAAVTGLGLVQSDHIPGDRTAYGDLSNGQIFIQKVDGFFQFFVQAGLYSIPSIGTPYTPFDVSHGLHNTFDAVPQAFARLVPTSNFYIEAGKLPTLIGAESTFTFENMNIERGLLWNQEPAISRGVQIGYTAGPIAFAASINDGYYSNRLNWVTGSAAWTINPTNTLTIVGGGNVGQTAYQTSVYVTPVAQNNSTIGNIIYTYNSAPWIITPYLQYSHVPANSQLGFGKTANSYAGAVLVSYAFSDKFSLAGRAEFITTDGSSSEGAANLLYGPGSKAYSLTATPTYLIGKYFVRAEGSWVHASSITDGDSFGSGGTKTNQFRGLLEGGVLF